MAKLNFNSRRILGSLSESPKTKRELMDALGLEDGPVVANLRRLKDKGMVFVSGSKPNRATQPSPIYATHAVHEMPQADEHKARIGKNAERLEAMLQAVRENGGPMTAEEIASWLQVERSLVDSALTYYRKGGRSADVFRVWSWVYVDRPRCGWTPQYGAGPGADAKKPAVDKREYMARWRERNRAKLRASDAVRRAAAGARTAAAENPFAQLMSSLGVAAHPKKGARVQVQDEMLEVA